MVPRFNTNMLSIVHMKNGEINILFNLSWYNWDEGTINVEATSRDIPPILGELTDCSGMRGELLYEKVFKMKRCENYNV